MPPRAEQLKPLWQTNDGQAVRLYHGHVTNVLAKLPAGSVQCVVTSPPYWGLRDYGTGEWQGGDPACDHVKLYKEEAHRSSTLGPTAEQRARGDYSRIRPADNAAFKAKVRQFKDACDKCGATRTDMQIGSEPSPDCGTQGKLQCGGCFVCSMVAVFQAVRRVLRDDGTVWLNLGDSYGDDGQLQGVPWRVALALQADGWVLRQDIVWNKPSAMPESVTSRCTKAHEYIFLLTKSEQYYYDHVAVMQGAARTGDTQKFSKRSKQAGAFAPDDPMFRNGSEQAGRSHTTRSQTNKRSVWTMSSGSGYSEAHFATFPPELPRTCVLAGTSEGGACRVCGTPAKRITKETALTRQRPNDYVKRTGEEGTGNSCANTVAGVEVETLGWEVACACGYKAGTRPCVVLDPFMGSGTTAAVCMELGRWVWGVDLSEDYILRHQVPRVEGVVRSRVDLAYKGLLPARQVVPYRAGAVVVGRRAGGK